MNTHFSILKITRNNILNAVKNLSLAEINTIPANYNNSIGWQVAHVVVTQQLLHYKLAKKEPLISEEFILKYKKGSSGKATLTETEWQEIKQMMVELPLSLAKDYNNNVFESYADYPTSYNFIISSIEEAILFNNIHEAMHFGTISALKKMVISKE